MVESPVSKKLIEVSVFAEDMIFERLTQPMPATYICRREEVDRTTGVEKVKGENALDK